MGVVAGIGISQFPKQGIIGKRVVVCFEYDTSKTVKGTVVRDDMDAPWQMIIKLDDGRYVLAEECQYSTQLR